MPEDLLRAFALMERADVAAGTRVDGFRYGKALFTPKLPLLHDANYLLVDRLEPRVGAVKLAAEAERLQGAAGLAHRRVMIRDAATGDRLARRFASLGWTATWNVVMAHRRRPERRVDTSLAAEVDAGTLREALYAWATPDLRRQLLARERESVEIRHYAVVAAGKPASWCELYLDDGVAQVEHVATVERHRNKGYASAVVLRAVEEARRAGSELVFLVALADDWPKDLYARLGFDEIGRYVKFMRLISDHRERTPPRAPAP